MMTNGGRLLFFIVEPFILNLYTRAAISLFISRIKNFRKEHLESSEQS